MRGRVLAALGVVGAFLLLERAGSGLSLPTFEGLRFDLCPVSVDTGDLVIPPGGRGFLDSLGTGPQHHQYDEARDRTTVLDEVWLGQGSFRFAVAEYHGTPSRDVAPEGVVRLDVPHAFLIVRRGGEVEGTVVKPGTTLVDGQLPLTLARGEIVWLEAGPHGIHVLERHTP